MRARDAWMAVGVHRPEDLVAFPAWVDRDRPAPTPDDVTGWLERELASCDAHELVARAELLGLAVTRVGETTAVSARHVHAPGAIDTILGEEPARSRAPQVVDLSALWAGPLAGSLVALAGAEVIKVESASRFDGFRRLGTGWFDVLNASKRSVVLDLTTSEGIDSLTAVIARADIVIEASRPRALEQMGIDPVTVLRDQNPSVWVSITGHGRNRHVDGPGRVAFGDDAAVAGGLVLMDACGDPVFAADAIADPLTGIVAASAAAQMWQRGITGALDLAMATVAAAAAGAPSSMPSPEIPAQDLIAPRCRRAETKAPPAGTDTAAVLAELDRRPDGTGP